MIICNYKFLGGKLLSFHTDFIPDSGLTPLSSLWVGAWWPGFLFSFLGAALCGFLIFCYPSRINKHQTLSRTEQTDVDKSQSIIQGLKNVLLKTLSNPLYILISLAVGADSMLLAGLSAFLPKYAQTQFKLSAGKIFRRRKKIISNSSFLRNFSSSCWHACCSCWSYCHLSWGMAHQEVQNEQRENTDL